MAAAVAVLAVVLLLTRLGGGNQGAANPGTSTDTPSKSTSRSSRASATPSQSASQTPSESPSTTPEQVDVNESDYLGRPKDDVRKDLQRLGLTVDEQEVDNPGDKPRDTVSAVSPTGKVDKGSGVTVSFYGAPTPTPTQTQSPTESPTENPTETKNSPGSGHTKVKGGNGEVKSKP